MMAYQGPEEILDLWDHPDKKEIQDLMDLKETLASGLSALKENPETRVCQDFPAIIVVILTVSRVQSLVSPGLKGPREKRVNLESQESEDMTAFLEDLRGKSHIKERKDYPDIRALEAKKDIRDPLEVLDLRAIAESQVSRVWMESMDLKAMR
ncbi:unnamed protein product, partial [Oppiella nova]